MKNVTILTGEPDIVVLAEQKLDYDGVLAMANWVQRHRPHCVPERGFKTPFDLLPHDRHDAPVTAHGEPSYTDRRTYGLTDNEVLAEIAGRKCYDSFADAAGRKTNKDYFEHIFAMDPVHASILYHAKMTFFFGGVSRKFSHQFIRNYVGSDRDEEGSPSQESTRFTHHYGFYVAPPYMIEHDYKGPFAKACQANYDEYNTYLDDAVALYKHKYGKEPTGGAKKDIYEAAAGLLSMSAETSFVWTTNPMALRKFLKERCHGAADAEIYRFARKLAKVCFERWHNLFLGADLDAVRKELA